MNPVGAERRPIGPDWESKDTVMGFAVYARMCTAPWQTPSA
jgi:hypothetical protein